MFWIAVKVLVLLLVPPFLLGVIRKVQALVAGRRGPPVLQTYYDLTRLLKKGVVYGQGTSPVFRMGPVVALAATWIAALFVPILKGRAPLGFDGDMFVFASLLALARFATLSAALDTGSPFEGMGASREATFAAFTEPALFLALALLAIPVHELRFGSVFGELPLDLWAAFHPSYFIAAVVLFVVLLVETNRIPFDDPNTHLELTMIHEVMVLDHSGPDLAFILYGQSVKLFALSALVIRALLPLGALPGALAFLAMGVGLCLVAVAVGVVESTLVRLRLLRIPQILAAVSLIAALGLAILLYRGPL